MTHTLETTSISRGVARALRLNEDLTESIGLGHDVGHPPFGHAGEAALDAILDARHGRRFRHNEQSLRVVDLLERDGRGLNLTWEVRDGILKHTGPEEPETLEGRIVRIVDRVAYINHDIDDAVRAGVLAPEELPAEEIELLGSHRLGARSTGSSTTSSRRPPRPATIAQSDEVGEAMLSLRTFMFDRVYLGPRAAGEHRRARETVEAVFDHLAAHPEELPPGPGDEVQRRTDYVAGMTDRFALAYAERIA